jgi:hypothetical protein
MADFPMLEKIEEDVEMAFACDAVKIPPPPILKALPLHNAYTFTAPREAAR